MRSLRSCSKNVGFHHSSKTADGNRDVCPIWYHICEASPLLLDDCQPELAPRDAMQAQVCFPEWATAFYMQALALSKLGMESDAQYMLSDGASFEAKKQNSWCG
ncbi:hypothetical protein NMG60_11023216 [Bertholletia excelsa]